MEHQLLNGIAMRLMVLKGKRSLRQLERASKAPMQTNLALLKKILKQNRNTANMRISRRTSSA